MKKTSRGVRSENRFDVVGVCTDTYRPNADGQYGAISWYRIISPLEKLGATIIGQLREVTLSPEWAMDFAKNGKIWFMKMTDNEGIDFYIDVARKFMGCKYVLDLDDDPYSFSKNHPEYAKLKERMPQVKKMIKMADHVVVSTEEIKKVIEKDNPYVTVIPNAIDPDIWNVKNATRTDGKVHIGWIASASHIADIPVILPVLVDLVKKHENVHIHFAGMVDLKILDVENPSEELVNVMTLQRIAEMGKVKIDLTPLLGRFTHHVGTQGYKDYPAFLASLGLDIALAPLEDTQFNRCKSNIKWMEHAMLEIPMVLSAVGPYQESVKHGENGFLAKTSGDWAASLSFLIENPAERKKIGKNAKQAVLAGWDIKDQLPKYEKLLKKLNEKPILSVVTAIGGKKDELRDQVETDDVEYVAFVEPKVKSSFWKTRELYGKFRKPVMNAKIHKILTHKYVDTPYILWVDGNVDLKVDPKEFIKLLGDKDFAFFKHPGRDDVYDEADACVALGKGDPRDLAEQTVSYAKRDYPKHAGLSELTVFIRKNNEHANRVFEQWWAEVCRYSERDQVAFPVVFEKEQWATIPGSVGFDEQHESFPGNRYFTIRLHRK